MVDLRRTYNERTEAYDQTICTRRTPDDVAVPASGEQSAAINKNATAVKCQLMAEFCDVFCVDHEKAEQLWKVAGQVMRGK